MVETIVERHDEIDNAKRVIVKGEDRAIQRAIYDHEQYIVEVETFIEGERVAAVFKNTHLKEHVGAFDQYVSEAQNDPEFQLDEEFEASKETFSEMAEEEAKWRAE